MRGNRLILPLACAVLLSACGKTRFVSAGPPPVNPSTAIAMSVLAESVYLVDPVSGDRALVASNLGDFQSGFATWAPDHRRLAYSDGGIVVFDTKTRRRHLFAGGSSLSAPAWSHDGSRLAYGNGTTLWLTPAATYEPSRLRLLTWAMRRSRSGRRTVPVFCSCRGRGANSPSYGSWVPTGHTPKGSGGRLA